MTRAAVAPDWLVSACASRAGDGPLETPAKAYAAIVAATARSSELDAAPARGGLAPHTLRRAQEVLLANLRTGRPSKAIAGDLGLSPGHFTRAFREAAGLPPHQWRMNARLSAAKVMMATGSASLAEIALSCGFSDQAHLTRIFKREEGVSPAAWRRDRARRTLAANQDIA